MRRTRPRRLDVEPHGWRVTAMRCRQRCREQIRRRWSRPGPAAGNRRLRAGSGIDHSGDIKDQEKSQTSGSPPGYKIRCVLHGPTADDRELNRETLRIHLLGVEHAVGIHGFSMPCPPECPRREITHGEARDCAAAILREKSRPSVGEDRPPGVKKPPVLL